MLHSTVQRAIHTDTVYIELEGGRQAVRGTQGAKKDGGWGGSKGGWGEGGREQEGWREGGREEEGARGWWGS